ncbi:MAG: hypothetical protein V1844_27260 [Pseudomonadota bacterium]
MRGTLHWELPGFLREIEAVLKERDPDGYIRFSMGRVLGRAAVESLTSPSGVRDAEVITRDDMILWVMDVRGYTTLAEGWPAEQNFKLLNPLFKIVHEELEETGGVLLEFAGDSIVIAFNTPHTRTVDFEQVLAQTVRCFRRLHMHNALSLLRPDRRKSRWASGWIGAPPPWVFWAA